jgi:gliding motility-associated lipoprotein GldD
MNLVRNKLWLILILISIITGCRNIPVPKPRGYFRIDLPPKEYIKFSNQGLKPGEMPVSFEYPAYGRILYESFDISEPGWVNIDFPDHRARIYMTYKGINKNLESLIEQSYRMNVKNHIIKADAISEKLISYPDRKIYGILYDLKGSTASAVQFFVTDSIKHFFRGSLYFSAEPNPDSLSPVIEFFREDIVHLIETLEWESK